MTQEFSVFSNNIFLSHSVEEPRALAIAYNVWGYVRPHWPITPKEAIHFWHWAFYLLSYGV